MSLVSTKEILQKAKEGGYAVGAFNIENMEMAQAVVAAAEHTQSPVILQTTESTLRYGSLELYQRMVECLAAFVSVPVALHLDHGQSFETVKNAIKAGYTSVMIDGSKLAFRDNIALTKKVVALAHEKNIPVEAELGILGGKEEIGETHKGALYTDPQWAKEFVELTGTDFLAVAIGTAHGHYQGVPVLDFDLLGEINTLLNVPLVLHGSSGVPDEDVKRCIGLGICKVNYATDLRDAFSSGLREILKDPMVYDPKVYGKEGRNRVFELVKQKITVCGSGGKAC